MSTAPVTLDFSKAQKIKPEEGVQLDFSKAQRISSGQDTAALEQPGFLSQAGSVAANQLGIPASPQDVSEAGSALGSDLWGMAKGLPKMVVNMSIPGMAYQGLQKAKEQYNALRTGQPTPEQQRAEEQKAAGHGWYYRNIATPVAEGIGVNVPGMEEAAKKGSIGGVIGHAAAVPAAMAITEGASRGLPPIVRGAKSAKSGISEWARGDPNAAITEALHVGAKSPKMQSAIADVEGSRPYLQGAKSQAEVQSRLPSAKAEVWDNYAKAVESVKDQPVQGPDGPTTVGELEAARLKNSADLQAARKIRPTDQQTALQKQENLTRMIERDKQIKAVLDPILQKTGIDPATIREVHGHLKGVERNVSGKSTVTEQMRPYGFGKMLPHRVRGFGTGSPTLGTSWEWEPIQGVKDIVAGRPKFHGKPTDVAMKDLFAPKRAKPNLGSIRKP